MAAIVCGVDVSSDHLDARVGRDGPERRFADTPDGLDALAAFRREHGAGLVATEAAGGGACPPAGRRPDRGERLAFAGLWAAGVPVAVANPRQVRRFAEAMGFLERTDRLDAGLIAWFAEARGLGPQAPAGDARRELTALVRRLRRLTEALVQQRNQRRLADDPDVLASADALAACLVARIRALEARVAGLIGADPLWAALDQAFREVKGVAGRTVARLAAGMPEIGTLSGKAAAELAGLAPLADDSGRRQGRRPVRGGREGVRSILFVVAELARRHDPDTGAFHRRSSEAGKPRRVVRVAVAHRLLTRLNAKARDARRKLAQPA